MRVLILKCSGGLSNRLIPLLCCVDFCLQNRLSLGVIWERNRYLHSSMKSLSHYFEKLPTKLTQHNSLQDALNHYRITLAQVQTINMRWKNKMPRIDKRRVAIYLHNVCHMISISNSHDTARFYPHPTKSFVPSKFPQLTIIQNVFYEQFTLSNAIKQRISALQQCNIGLHIRTRDGGFAKAYKKHQQNFDDQIHNMLLVHATDQSPVYISADTEEMHKKLKKTFVNKIVMHDDITKFNARDGATDAMVDMIMLSKCDTLYVTPGSSFSFLAFILNRRIENKRIKYLKLEF